MAQQETQVMEKPSPGAPQVTPPPAPPAGGKKKKRKGAGRVVKLIITLVVIAAVVAAVAVVLYLFVFKEDNSLGIPMTDYVYRSSIQSMVEGSGNTRAADSATVTPTSGGTLLEVFVQEGDQVMEGDPLYTMDDSAAQQAVLDAQAVVDDAAKNVTNCQKDLQSVYDAISDLTISAPHSGKLMEVAVLKAGDTVNAGDRIATLVNDTKLRLSLYYSYAYEGDIYEGQPVNISIPAIMGDLPGKVEQINYVRRVVSEGGVMFEVIFVLDNPGTLTEDMDASAAVITSDGSAIYPYENGKLAYYETTQIIAKARGPVETANLMNYADVTAGQVLVQLGQEDQDQEIAAKELALQAAQDRLKEAEDKLLEAQKSLENHNAVAPISGTVLSCNLVAGSMVESGQAITIADTSVMTIEIQVDERNVQYVKPGMYVDIDQWGNYYLGVVESVSQIANAQNGVASYPAVVKVDNPDGSLMSGMYVSYSFVASQSDNCLTVPIQAVKYVTFSNGGMGGDFMEGGFMGEDGMYTGGDGYLDEDGMGGDGDGYLDGDGTGTDGDGYLDEDGMSGSGEGFSEDGSFVLPENGEAMPLPESYTGGAVAKPLGMAIVSSGGMYTGSSGRYGSTSASNDGAIVFVKADTAPDNAILEPDPSWQCPNGFWAVPVEVGLADNSRVEILSGLNEGDEVFIGYEKQQADSWG